MPQKLNCEKLSIKQKKVVTFLEKSNGEILLSLNSLAEKMKFGKSTAQRAIEYLLAKKWIAVEVVGNGAGAKSKITLLK